MLLYLVNHDKNEGWKIGNPLPVIKVTQILISRIKNYHICHKTSSSIMIIEPKI